MYKVTAYFKDHKVAQKFYDLYDAIDYRDSADANYPIKVTFEKVKDMREHIYDTWNSVMDANINPLRNIPNLQVRHLIMQILAWMWVSVCSMYLGSIMFWGINAIAHTLLLAAIVITVGTFDTAQRNPKLFNKINRIDGYNGRRVNGEHD